MAAWFDDASDENDDVPEMSLAEPIKAVDIQKRSENLARSYIDQFFGDRMMHCGGKIPKRMLHDSRRINMVLNFNIMRGVDAAYEMLEHTIDEEEVVIAKKMGDSTSDVKLVNETLKILARAGVPQQFAGGMLLMHLELVEGVNPL